jgi:predicted phage tail protein
MDLISEGPIFGPAAGSPAQSVYLNNVPLQNADGSNNFVVDGFDFRYGEIDQTYIPGFDSSSQETSVGVEFKQVTPWNVTVTDLDVNAIVITLGVNSLSQTNSSNGDVTGYEVDYQIQLSVDGGAYAVVVNTSFNGKASSTYERSHRIALSGATSQYALRVVRTTPDTTSVFIADTTTVVSYAEVIDAKLRYPLSSVCALSVDAVQFSSLPTRSYDMKGLLIKYPSNYNPTTRAYVGTWDGTFVTGWTDNPAWIFYDLVLNNRYGLGQWVDASMVDRFALYIIAQYCDVMVSDGMGGQEPRFTCNCYIQSRADAYKVLQDLASVFRGMAYWSAGNVVATCDMPTDPVYIYTAANTIGGQFKYVGSSLKTRYTVALVTWNDPNNNYQQAVEYVEDIDGIARYGINKAQITAFGCTSRGQAQRVGHWSILTSRFETNTVTFSVGLDGTLAQPGQIIAIADPARAARRLGGRIHATSGTNQVTLDKAMQEAAVGDTLTVVTPGGVTTHSSISAISGAVITVNPPLAAAPVVGAIWMIESATVESALFRVLSVADKGGIAFDVTATQYEPAKYAAIDDGAAMDVRPVTGNTFTTQVPPTGITVTQYVVIDQGIARTNMTIAWQAAASAVSYKVQWQKDNGTWVDAGTTGTLSLDVTNIYSGNYVARVMCTNGMGISSVYAFSASTTLAGKTGAPPTVATLTASTDQVFAIRLNWTFPPNAGDTAYTEIYSSHTTDFSTATQLGRYSYPTSTTNLIGLVAGFDMYFWARLVDTSGNIGAFFPATTGAGVHGMSTMDATAILVYLTGQITATQLAQDLATPIAAIPTIQTNVAANTVAINSNSAAISQEISDRITAIANEAAARGAAVTSEQTARQTADTSLGQRIDTVTASVNSNASAIQAEQTARANGDSANASSITALTSVVGTKNTTFRQSITPISQAVGDTWVDTGSTNLLTFSQTFTNAVWALALVTTASATTAPDGTNTGYKVVDSDNSTGFHSVQCLGVSADTTQTYTASIFVRQRDSTRPYFVLRLIESGASSNYLYGVFNVTSSSDAVLQSGTAGASTGASATITPVGGGWFRCSVSGKVSGTGTGFSIAISSPLTATNSFNYTGVSGQGVYVWGAQIEQNSGTGRYIPTTTASVSTVGNNSLLVWDGTTWQLSQDAAIPANAAAIASESTTRATADTALSNRIDTISAQVVIPPEAGSTTDFAGSTTVFAGIYTEQSARAEADLALASQVNNVTAQVNTYSNSLFAAVQVETTARISADAATASQLTTVQTQVNQNSAAVATNAAAYTDLNGRVSASYTIRAQVTTGGRTYISGIGVGIDNNSGVVESQVLVTADRFAVLETSGNSTFSPFVIQNGQAFINQAFIGSAWITTATIADANITTAKIANAAITNAQIGTAAIQTANIADANITSAKIGNAQIQTAHIGEAQIDTLRIGANAVSTQVQFSNGGTGPLGTYTSSGYPCTILMQSQVPGGAGAGTCILNKDGGSLLSCTAPGGTGVTTGVTFTLVTLGAGAHTFDCTGASSGTKIVIFEAKR